jgi:hypothetical protein
VTTAYYARLYEQRGVVARIDRALTFLDLSTAEAVVLEAPDCQWLVVTGEVEPERVPMLREQMRGCHDHLRCRLGE